VRGRLHVLAADSEKVVEQRFSSRNVDVLALAGLVDVLEQGEAIHPHLEAALGHEAAKPMHEQAQHLVDVDDEQGPVRAHLDR
jgi:hypothetical protein